MQLVASLGECLALGIIVLQDVDNIYAQCSLDPEEAEEGQHPLAWQSRHWFVATLAEAERLTSPATMMKIFAIQAHRKDPQVRYILTWLQCPWIQ